MKNLSDLEGKDLALVLYGESIKGKEQSAVFFGKARVTGKDLYLDRGSNTPRFKLPENALRRLQKVADDIKETLSDADYWTWLTIGDVPEGESLTGYQPTPLKWPKQ